MEINNYKDLCYEIGVSESLDTIETVKAVAKKFNVSVPDLFLLSRYMKIIGEEEDYRYMNDYGD